MAKKKRRGPTLTDNCPKQLTKVEESYIRNNLGLGLDKLCADLNQPIYLVGQFIKDNGLKLPSRTRAAGFLGGNGITIGTETVSGISDEIRKTRSRKPVVTSRMAESRHVIDDSRECR